MSEIDYRGAQGLVAAVAGGFLAGGMLLAGLGGMAFGGVRFLSRS